MRRTGFFFIALAILFALLLRPSCFGAEQQNETSPAPPPNALAEKPATSEPGRPPPPIPLDAVMLHDFEPLELTITADHHGCIQKVEISKPKKPKSYHLHIRTWVAQHWRMPEAGPQEPALRKFIAPIVFDKKSMPRGQFPDPVYPQSFLINRVIGSVELEMEIAPSGVVRVVKVVGGSHNEELDKYVKAWVKVMWKFPPGYEGPYYHKFTFVIR
jgi:TonB family protein